MANKRKYFFFYREGVFKSEKKMKYQLNFDAKA